MFPYTQSYVASKLWGVETDGGILSFFFLRQKKFSFSLKSNLTSILS